MNTDKTKVETEEKKTTTTEVEKPVPEKKPVPQDNGDDDDKDDGAWILIEDWRWWMGKIIMKYQQLAIAVTESLPEE